GGVEAWSVDPHGPGQLRQRGALVPARPEHLQGPGQCLIPIELSRASRGHGDLLVKKMLSALDRRFAGPYTFIVLDGTNNSSEEISMARSTKERPRAGKVAVVPGGPGGIGAGIAKRLAGDGASVAVTYS